MSRFGSSLAADLWKSTSSFTTCKFQLAQRAAPVLALFFWPGGLLGRASFFALIPAAAMIAAAVMTSHAASRMEHRLSQSARTFPWVIVDNRMRDHRVLRLA